MGHYIRRRVLTAIPVFFGITLLVFFLFDLAPGSIADLMGEGAAASGDRAALEAALGLDRPPLLRYLQWLGGLLRGDLGESFFYGRPVAQLLAQRVGPSLLLTGTGVVLAVALASLAARFRWVRDLLSPLVAVVKAVPVVSFIILALIFFSSENLSLLISALMVFPPVYLNVLEGIGHTDRQLLEMARVFRVPLSRQLRGIYLPAVLPYFRSAVSLGLGLCWKSGAAAEVIGLPAGSIGEALYTAKVYFQTGDLFAWTAVIVTVSVIFERLFLRLVDAAVRKAGS